MAAGLSGTSSRRSTFGTALYTNLNQTTTSSGAGLSGNRTGGFGGSGMGYAGLNSSTTSGTRRAPQYSAALSFPQPAPMVQTGLQTNLQQMLTQAPALQLSRGIQVAMDGSTVVLRGTAADDHDRRLAEGLIRLTPGVRYVRNEMQVAATAGTLAPTASNQPIQQP